MPQPESQSVTQQESKPSAKAQPATEPTPKEAPVAKAVPTPEPEQLAMLRSTPPPAINPPDETDPSLSEPAPESVPRSAPRPKPQAPASNYRAEKDQNRITGSLNNRGPSAANAVGTPYGKYRKAVSDSIGSRWYYYIKAKGDLASVGTAVIYAEVDKDGHLQNMRVVSNTSNEAFANICLQSFQEAHIPPIPPDLVSTFPDGRMSIDFSFTMYSNQW